MLLWFSIEVMSVEFVSFGGWDVMVSGEMVYFDYFVFVNGIFFMLLVFDFLGVVVFMVVGGLILFFSELYSLDFVMVKNVFVIGYGKLVCDIVVVVVFVVVLIIVVVCVLLWKMLCKIKNVVNYKFLMFI